MIKQNLVCKNNFLKKDLSKKFSQKLLKEFKKIIEEVNLEINNNKKLLSVLNKDYRFNFNLNDFKKFKKFKTIALVGMGGSVLGTEAIYNFLAKKIKKKVYFFNNLDFEKIIRFKKKEKKNKVLFLIISKSGNTLETLSNLFSLNIIKKNSKNIIIITKKKNSFLSRLVDKFNLFYVEHNKFVGGRYSVLSEVGILPSYLIGINIFKLRSQIREYLKGKNKLFLKESSINLAKIMLLKKKKNLIFLNYVPELENFLYWCQQLIAESLGKKGKGFLPVISNVPKDHHSLLQLYLDGPKDKLFYIFSFKKKEETNEKINLNKISLKKNFLHNKKLSTIKEAQKNAMIKSLKKNKISFREFKLNNIKEDVLGKLFSYFMLETIILAKLVNLNPFDQPAVEQVKIDTKKLISK
tara:strand:- start:219 stop:1445 length:1227 start_codon:yes stop_codon:yes gene_type:complete